MESPGCTVICTRNFKDEDPYLDKYKKSIQRCRAYVTWHAFYTSQDNMNNYLKTLSSCLSVYRVRQIVLSSVFLISLSMPLLLRLSRGNITVCNKCPLSVCDHVFFTFTSSVCLSECFVIINFLMSIQKSANQCYSFFLDPRSALIGNAQSLTKMHLCLIPKATLEDKMFGFIFLITQILFFTWGLHTF